MKSLGLRGFSDSLAADYADNGIRVSTVYPFFSRTPILDSEQFGYETRREDPNGAKVRELYRTFMRGK